MWRHRGATIYGGGAEMRSTRNRNVAQKLWCVAGPSIKTGMWTAVNHLLVIDYDLEQNVNANSASSCARPMLFHHQCGYCGTTARCSILDLGRNLESMDEQCLTEKDGVRCEISATEKSIFVSNISRLQQPTQQAYACLWAGKTTEKKGFHC